MEVWDQMTMFNFHLTNREQFVSIIGYKSKCQVMKFDVPRGSVFF